jgi:hypothetical protein
MEQSPDPSACEASFELRVLVARAAFLEACEDPCATATERASARRRWQALVAIDAQGAAPEDGSAPG